MITRKMIIDICQKYRIVVNSISDIMDTSHGENDLRYNYIINNSYVLKMNNSPTITEERVGNIYSLVNRYLSIGVWAPALIKNIDDNFVYHVVINQHMFNCYIEEYSPYLLAQDFFTGEKRYTDVYALKKEMIGHVGMLAKKYTNKDLFDYYSMWSIIDLAPYDMNRGIDEKQVNLNRLIAQLYKYHYTEVAQKLEKINLNARKKILSHFKELPRCVFQGDLNPSNLCIDEQGQFKGIIDFNMSGTEVNINCFINESMYYIQEKDFETLSAIEIYKKMNNVQIILLKEIFKYYTLNAVEKNVFMDYKRLIDISFYPNVELWIHLIEKHLNEDKVIALLNLIADV